MLKKITFLTAIVYTIALLIVSLIRLDKMPPELDINNGDKMFHCLSYALLSFLWYKAVLYKLSCNKPKAVLYASIFSISFGIVIEILQSVLTTYRTLDFYDILANTAGVIIVVFVLLLNRKIDIKKI